MKRLAWNVAMAVMFVLGILAVAYCQEKPEPAKQTFVVAEVESTDGSIAALEELTLKKAVEMTPNFTKGMFAPGNKNKLVIVSKSILVPLKKSARQTADGQETMSRRQMWALRPFGATLETQVVKEKDGTYRARRAYHAAVTKAGSVIRGGQVYGLSPDEIQCVLRVTNNGQGFDLTWIYIHDGEDSKLPTISDGKLQASEYMLDNRGFLTAEYHPGY